MRDLLERRNAVVRHRPVRYGQDLDGAGARRSGTTATLSARNHSGQCQQRPVESRERSPTPDRRLFYVEDPWGQYSLRGGADIWTEQLPRLLREAHAGHQYVVTSRTDMLGQARADEGLKRWTVVLDADQYRDGELAAIYDKRLELLATDLQAKALDFRTDALDALETPLEVDLFFTHMADGPRTG